VRPGLEVEGRGKERTAFSPEKKTLKKLQVGNANFGAICSREEGKALYGRAWK